MLPGCGRGSGSQDREADTRFDAVQGGPISVIFLYFFSLLQTKGSPRLRHCPPRASPGNTSYKLESCLGHSGAVPASAPLAHMDGPSLVPRRAGQRALLRKVIGTNHWECPGQVVFGTLSWFTERRVSKGMGKWRSPPYAVRARVRRSAGRAGLQSPCPRTGLRRVSFLVTQIVVPTPGVAARIRQYDPVWRLWQRAGLLAYLAS